MANLNKAPVPFTYIGDGSTPHPLVRSPALQGYRVTIPDSAGGTVAAGNVKICDAVGGIFLVTYDNGTTREAAIFMTTATTSTVLVAITAANWTGGTSATAGDISFYYNSSDTSFYLRNDVAAAEYTFDIYRLA